MSQRLTTRRARKRRQKARRAGRGIFSTTQGRMWKEVLSRSTLALVAMVHLARCCSTPPSFLAMV